MAPDSQRLFEVSGASTGLAALMFVTYLHHTLIHFPIALVIVGALAIASGVLFDWDRLRRAGGWCLMAALATGALAAITGLMSIGAAAERGVSIEAIESHRNIAIAAMLLTAIALGLWSVGQGAAGRPGRHRAGPKMPALASGLGLAAAGAITWAAHVGGAMVHPRLELARVLGLKEKIVASRPTRLESAGHFKSQVAYGAAIFEAECAGCHGERGGGSELVPALLGPNSTMIGERFGSALELLEFVETKMPSNAPGSLEDHHYLSVCAWILDQHGFLPPLNRGSASRLQFFPDPS